MKNKKICCIILSLGKKYEKLSRVAHDSFLQFNKNIDIFHINDLNIHHYEANNYINKISIGVLKYLVALEITKKYKYDKTIIIGSDTITCSRLDEFLDDYEYDILATLDYPYQLITPRVKSPNSETHLNADVICFNNFNALEDIIKVSLFHPIYHEQGGLNEIVWNYSKYKTKIVDAPYETSKVVYNARAKGNIIANNGEKPWKNFVSKYKVINNKLYTHNDKQIKIFHYCDGLGTLNENSFNNLLNWWIFECFNEETKIFFKNYCDTKDFFEKKYEDC